MTDAQFDAAAAKVVKQTREACSKGDKAACASLSGESKSDNFYDLSQGAGTVIVLIAASLIGIFLRRSKLVHTRGWRYTMSASVLWLLTLQLWGYIWRWESHFTAEEFAVLHIAVPLMFGTALVLKRWVRNGVG